jgi:hypothetical protein
VYGSKYLVYQARLLAQDIICKGGWYISHVERTLADFDEYARDSTHMRGIFHCIGQVPCA